MHRLVRAHLTYANVMVTILAFVVLGGAAFAASRLAGSSNRISACAEKNGGTLRIVKRGGKCSTGEFRISWNRRGRRGFVGQQGATGPQGVTGPDGTTGVQGVTGPTGIQGTPGLSGVHTISETGTPGDSTDQKSHTTNCPTGEVAVGGGAFLRISALDGSQPTGVALVRSLPNFFAGNAPTGWTARALEINSNAGSWELVVQAVCATVAP
jgi:hypothetical protein